ncbi:hypothetical protein [Bacillus pinisoli]|uniref:hypothetical protein n=1 Tax=Bacillus pinisoli TaxID=2901866 RepID=UPI001FF52CF3|nr:hypothetical protein [Bacillus pinisoli]
MVFWNVEKLAIKLKNGKVAEKEKFLYFFIFIMSSSLFTYFPIEYASNGYKYLEMFFSLTISISGIIVCYQLNQKGDGKFFIERFISLGFPIGIKIIIYGILLYLLFLIISLFITGGNLIDHSFIDISFLILVEIAFYVMLYRWMRFVSH